MSKQTSGTGLLEALREDDGHQGLGLSIEQSATWSLDSAEQGAEFSQAPRPEEFYSRWGNPTVRRFEDAIATLEGGQAAIGTSSGMGAIATALLHFGRKRGQHVLAQTSLYSATQELMTGPMTDYGVETTLVRASDTQAFRDAMREDTSLVYLETPSNPLLSIADVEAIAEHAGELGVPVLVDNTFAGPVNQRPLELGADVVLHSATKSLAGHSDVTGGALVADEATVEECWKTYKMLGPTLGPNDAFLIHRGMKTLALRAQRQNENALAIAEFLQDHDAVSKVFYPGLNSHAGHAVAARQMDGFGGILSFEVDGGVEAGRRVLEATEVCLLGVSLGSVETLVQHPASMTHAPLTSEQRREAGIADGLIRLSLGIEETDDLIEDLGQALAKT